MNRHIHDLRRLGRTCLTLAALAIALLFFVAMMGMLRPLWSDSTPDEGRNRS